MGQIYSNLNTYYDGVKSQFVENNTGRYGELLKKLYFIFILSRVWKTTKKPQEFCQY